MYYVSSVDIYNGVSKVLSQSLNGNEQFEQHLPLTRIIFRLFSDSRKHCTARRIS